jgi:hypothetical protein
MKLLNNNKMRMQLFSLLSLTVVMVGLFQNCAQTGDLSLSTSLNVEEQKMTNTFYVQKNSSGTFFKPILTNKEASDLLLSNVNASKQTDSAKLDSSDPAAAPTTDNSNPSPSNEPNELFEIQMPQQLPINTEHGKVLSIDKNTGIFEYVPNEEYVGNDRLVLIKVFKMEVNSSTKDAIKSEDGKFYLQNNKPIAVSLVVHDHVVPVPEVTKSEVSVSSAEEDADFPRVAGPIETDKTSPEKPPKVDDGKFPDKLPNSPKMTWTHSYDADSGINFYEMAIGHKPGEADVVKWTNVGFVTSASLVGKFNPDEVYYSSVRAVDFAGLRSDIAAGDGWQSSQITSESLIAEVTSPKFSTSSKIEFKIKFTQPVDKLTVSQLSLTNIKGTPVITGAMRNYSVAVDANAQGAVELKITKGAVFDVFANKTVAEVSSSTLFDSMAPALVSIKADVSPILLNKAKASMKVTFTFSENMTTDLFSIANNISISNPAAGSFDNLVCSALICTANFTANDSFTSEAAGVTLSYKDKSTFTDPAGNMGLNKSTPITNVVVDRLSPTLQISVAPNDNNSVGPGATKTILFNFSEAVVGFSHANIEISDASLGSISEPVLSGTTGKVYSIIYNPVPGVKGTVNIGVKAGSFTDVAKNVGETATPFTLNVSTKLFTDADGGQISYNGDYKIHTFSNVNSSETFSIKSLGNDKANQANNNFEVLLVGGGAGGGYAESSPCWITSLWGGGGGGISYYENVFIPKQSYPVNVGAGAAGGSTSGGGNSSFYVYTATGGFNGGGIGSGGVGTYANGGTGSYGGRSSQCPWGCATYNSAASNARQLNLKNGLSLSLSAGGGAGWSQTIFLSGMPVIPGTAGGTGGGGNGGMNNGDAGTSATGGPGIGYGSGGGGGSHYGILSNNCGSRKYPSGSGYQGVVIISYKYK